MTITSPHRSIRLQSLLARSQHNSPLQHSSYFLLSQDARPRVASFIHAPTRRQLSTPSATRINHAPSLNPPSSTLPPPLVLPVRAESQSAPSYYFSLGRAYLSFYKTGAKAVYSNWQTARGIRSRLPANTNPEQALQQGVLSRGEWLLIRRSNQDIKKVPLFALVFMICGEFTPLVVVFMSGVVPRTCKVPKQVLRDREKAEERRRSSFREGTVNSADTGMVDVETLPLNQLSHVGRSLGLYSSLLDRLGVGLPTSLLRRRVQQWDAYIGADDAAIEQYGGVERMEMEEVRIALEERGVDVLGRGDAQLQRSLQTWLRERKWVGALRLVLVRPGIWEKGG
ncbi:hypothetical protein MMC34_005359 [Xylographa carneopallida]|nr:hypothetical protein [Xylographa carneopallida]